MQIIRILLILISLCFLCPGLAGAQTDDRTKTFIQQFFQNVRNIDSTRRENAEKMKQIRKEAERNRDLIKDQNARNRQAQKDLKDKLDQSREQIRETQAKYRSKQQDQADAARRAKDLQKSQQQMLKDRMRSMQR